MRMPYLRETQKTQRQIVQFGGVNYGQNASDGELSESLNLSSAEFPCLSQRAGRKTHSEYASPTGLYARGELCVVDGENFLYGGVIKGTVTPGEKQFATINTKVVIFPDKVYYDTAADEFGSMEQIFKQPVSALTFSSTKVVSDRRPFPFYYTYTGTAGEWRNSVTVSGCEAAANNRSVIIPYMYSPGNEFPVGFPVSSTETKAVFRRTNATNTAGNAGVYGYDGENSVRLILAANAYTPGQIVSIKCANEANSNYGTISGLDWQRDVLYFSDITFQPGSYDTEITLEFTATPRTFFRHNSITVEDGDLSGFKAGDVVKISGCEDLPDNNREAMIREIDGAKLIFTDFTFVNGIEHAEVTIARKIPDLEYICQSNNRIWGVEGSTIWGSALGDPANFNIYEGLSTDSYAVAVGTDDDFTGCIGYGNSILFWKENVLHKLLGTSPSNYELYTYTIPGVQEGSHKSMAVINDVLYYKGRNGVYAYTGGTPELISGNFGVRRYSDAVSGTDGERYYISMKDTAHHLFVYDTLRGIWLREDDTHVTDFAFLDGTLHYLADTKVTMTGQDYAEEERVSWEAVFSPFVEQVMGKKCYSKMYMRLDLELGAWVQVFVSEDGRPFRKVWGTHDANRPIMTAFIIPTRCDSFKVKITGKGRVILKAFVREFDIGSEV